MIRSLKLISFSFTLFALTACSTHRDVEFVDTAGDLTKTGIGTTAGAAVGAGLGLLVGSASGNAGEGFVVGTLAGAAVGGVLGSQFDEQDRKIQSQQELLIRQEELLRNQERQDIEGSDANYRDISSAPIDITPSGSAPLAAASAGLAPAKRSISGSSSIIDSDIDVAEDSSYRREPPRREPMARNLRPPSESSQGGNYEALILDDYEGNPKAKPFGAAQNGVSVDSRRARLSRPTEGRQSEEQPALKTIPRASLPGAEDFSEPPRRIVSPTSVREVKRTLPKAKAVPAKVVTPKPKVVKQRRAPEKKVVKVAKLPPKVVPVVEEPKKIEDAAEDKPQSYCRRAEDEANRARSSSSDADKLFYFGRALRLCPKKAEYRVEIGQVYAELGRESDARFEYNQALEIDPEFEEAKEKLRLLETGA